MPTYVYRCTKCDVELEIVQKITDEPIVTCPECGTETLKKIIQPAGFVLKGSGWFRNIKNSDE